MGLHPLKFLIVDDNLHHRRMLHHITTSAFRSTVRECSDPVSALDVTAYWAPDLVLVDFEMAPFDGLEFTRRVRRLWSASLALTPIVMVSGHAGAPVVRAARAAGVDGFVVKPFNIAAVLDQIGNALSKTVSGERAVMVA